MNNFEINKASDLIWGEISGLDQYIQINQPFKAIKENKEKGEEMITYLVQKLYEISHMLLPIMPETSEKIKNCIKENKMPSEPLFLRKE